MCLEKPKHLVIYQNSNGESIKVWKIMSSLRCISLARGSINACLRYLGIWWFAFMLSLYALELALVPQVSSCCLEKSWFRIRRIYIEIWLGRGVYYLSGVLNIFPRVDLVTSLQSLQVVKLLKSDDMNKNRLWD